MAEPIATLVSLFLSYTVKLCQREYFAVNYLLVGRFKWSDKTCQLIEKETSVDVLFIAYLEISDWYKVQL